MMFLIRILLGEGPAWDCLRLALVLLSVAQFKLVEMVPEMTPQHKTKQWMATMDLIKHLNIPTANNA